MDYRTAKLSSEAVEQLQQLEQELSEETGEDIVLIAYNKSSEEEAK